MTLCSGYPAVNDADCVAFLKWVLPRLRMRWRGFRKVRGIVCERVALRMEELGLAHETEYRRYLESHPEELAVVDGLCRIPISRFHRDRRVFECLRDEVLPELAALASARGDPALRCWSAGCARGEEPYTVKVLWELCLRARWPDLRLSVVATDADEDLLARAREARFPEGSLKAMPLEWRAAAFEAGRGVYFLRPRFREDVGFRRQDIRVALPDGPFHLVLCRNLVMTYFERPLQKEILRRIADRIVPDGALVIGVHEPLPADAGCFAAWHRAIFRRSPDAC